MTIVGNKLDQRLASAVDQAIEKGEVGLHVAVYHHGELVADVAAGVADVETGRKVDETTLFWLGSVTKAMTATALHVQADRGLVDYDKPIAHYWPEFGCHGKERATVRDAVTHRSGSFLFPMDATVERMCDWDWVVGRLAEMHPAHEPGAQNAYHGYTFGYLLGEIVRRTDPKGRTFHQFLTQELFEPLGITDGLWLGAPDEVHHRIANVPDPDPAQGGDLMVTGLGTDIVTPYPAGIWPVQQVYGRADVRRFGQPSAGATGNGRSVARFFAMLANRGELGGTRYLSELVLPTFCVARRPGWDLRLADHTRMGMGGYWLSHPTSGNSAPMGSSRWVIGQSGAGGNLAWADIEHNFSVAIAANQSAARGNTPETNQIAPIGRVVREELGVPA